MKPLTDRDRATIRRAIRILEDHAEYSSGEACASAESARELAYLHLANEPSELFATAFLDNRHRLIAFERIFRGTIDGASVHPREVVRLALQHNAAAVIFAHNHPSGVSEPSQADLRITQRLKDALALIDVRVLDHIVVGSSASESVSLAERGLI